MIVTVTGKTFDHRDRLKDLGGRWNGDDKNWKFEYANAATIAKLKQLVGCMVVQSEPIDIVAFVETQAETPKTRDGSTTIYGDDPRYLNYFKDKNPISFFGFSNLAAMVKLIEGIPLAKRTGSRDQGFETSDPKWAGTPDMSAAIDLARNGWQEGVDNAARVVEFLNLEHATARRRAHSVAGGAVSVGRMLAGNPKHMVKRPKQPGRRVITLFVENTASASINARNLTVRAAVVTALADILERSGYSCEIVSVTIQARNFGGAPGAQTAVTLKNAGEKLNIGDLSFSLGHPSFLRRFNFACVSQADELRSIWSTQGFPASAFNSQHPTGRNEFYIKHLTNNVKNGPLEQMALEMLPLIKPDGLPLEIEK